MTILTVEEVRRKADDDRIARALANLDGIADDIEKQRRRLDSMLLHRRLEVVTALALGLQPNQAAARAGLPLDEVLAIEREGVDNGVRDE